jgi:hypothetical protein
MSAASKWVMVGTMQNLNKGAIEKYMQLTEDCQCRRRGSREVTKASSWQLAVWSTYLLY